MSATAKVAFDFYSVNCLVFHMRQRARSETCLMITINDTCTCDFLLVITIRKTSKNQPKRLDSDNHIKVSRLIGYPDKTNR